MLIPPGYCNVQYLMLDSSNQHQYLTAIGCQLEAADPATVASGFADAWADNLSPYVGQEVQGTETRLVIGTSNPSEPLIYNGSLFVAGAATGDTAPPNVALLVQKKTDQGGRRNRGRMYLPKPTESGIEESGQLSSSQYGGFVVAVNSFYDDCVAIDGVSGLYLFHATPPDDPALIVNLVGQQMVATQRRRLRR